VISRAATALPVISSIWGEAPTVPSETNIYVLASLHYTITCAKFQVEFFMGYDFTGVEFRTFQLPLHEPYNSAACD